MNFPVDMTGAVYDFVPILTTAVANGSAFPKTPYDAAVTDCVNVAVFGAMRSL